MKRLIYCAVCVLVLIGATSTSVWARHPEPSLDEVESLLPFRYARVLEKPVPVYAAPGDPAQATPVRELVPMNTWVSIEEEVRVDGRLWYRIGPDAYVLASDVQLASPSRFRGVVISPLRQPPLGFVVAEKLNVRARPGVSRDNPPIDVLPRYTVVHIMGREEAHDGLWYRIGRKRYVHSAYVRVVTTMPRPPEVGPDEKWIDVNLTEQTLAAYEGDRMVYATLISSGLPQWRTVEGLFRIWVKLRWGKMSGGSIEEGDYYYLEDVPWTMYFHLGYGLHAAYWHDGFGYPRSHGCVNLSPYDARWLFEWASPTVPKGYRAVLSSDENPGTWVRVHSTPAHLNLFQVMRFGGAPIM